MRANLFLNKDLPHRLEKDDIYKGMFLPKGSLVSLDNMRPCDFTNLRP